MADDEMSIAIPVPRDRAGRITLSDAQWTARLDGAIDRATEREGGSGAWAFDRVVGHDEQGNVVVRLRRWRPNERPLPAGPVEPHQHGDAKSERGSESRSDRAAAARVEAERRQAQRERAREQQRGGQGRDR